MEESHQIQTKYLVFCLFRESAKNTFGGCELVEHNDIYYYFHRITLNKEYEKEILDEFQRLDADGFLIHRQLDW